MRNACSMQVTISAEGVSFRLTKARHGLWEQLEAGGEKEAIVKRRNESIDRAHARLESIRLQRLERKKKEERCVMMGPGF